MTSFDFEIFAIFTFILMPLFIIMLVLEKDRMNKKEDTINTIEFNSQMLIDYPKSKENEDKINKYIFDNNLIIQSYTAYEKHNHIHVAVILNKENTYAY